MSDLDRRLSELEREQARRDQEFVEGWMQLIEAGNPRALELLEIARQRRDAHERPNEEN